MKKIFFFLLASTLFITSCVKQKFDEPTLADSTVDFKSNTTIAALKKLHTTGALEQIKTDVIVEGTVIADDASNNYYKTIVIQDSTAGIDVKITAASLFNDFPMGSKVLIKCNGLTLGDYFGLTQLGGGSALDTKGNIVLAGIEQALISTYVFKAGKGTVITPRVVKIADLNSNLASTLIQIDNVEFAKLHFGVPFADGPKKSTQNRNLVDCNGGTVFVRTSGYATFVNDLTPTGNGTIIGVYSTYNTDKQLYIRDLGDVSKMTNTRCDGTTGGGTGGTGGTSTQEIKMGDLRAIFTGTKTTAPANKFIKGVVISDAVNKNVQPSSCIVQGADGKGITVRFTGTHPYLLGDAIQVDVAGMEISEYNGLLQVNNVPLANAKNLGKGTLPTPKKLTIAQIIADFENVESTLVAIDNCSHTATKYGGNVVLDDKTGKITLYTSSSATLTATFAADVPVSNVLNIVGIIGQYTTATGNTNQIQMRNLADATKGSGGTTGGGSANVEPIGTIRGYFTGTLTKAPANKALRGVVISDKDGKNIPTLNAVIQGEDGKGILVRFTAAHTYPLGQLLEIDASNMELSEFNGVLQLNKVPLTNVKDLGKGTLPTPKVITLGQLATDAESLESTLVQVKNVDFGGAAKYGGTIKITDGTGTFDLFTSTSATYTAVFGADVPPAGAKTLTAIVSQFTTYQLQMRNASDVK
jgi:Family of unknown function (DUF5689)